MTGAEILLLSKVVGDLTGKTIEGFRSRSQRQQGEEILLDAQRKIEELDFDPAQETRQAYEAKKQQTESLQDLIRRNQQLQSAQLVSSNYDPTRGGAQISSLLDNMNRGILQTDMTLGAEKTKADTDFADIAEAANQRTLQKDLDLQNLRFQQGSGAAGLGLITGTAAASAAADVPASAFDALFSIDPDLLTENISEIFKGAKGGDLKSQIYKTGGEFNHDTNKKALVDEETGEKEAELTGEELVLNVDQGNNAMQAADILVKFVEENPNAPEDVRAAAELLAFFKEPQFQGPDEVDMPEDAVEEGQMIV